MGSVNILALESSTPVLGVGLLQIDAQGQQSFIQREFHGSSKHAEHVLPLVDEVLAQAQLERQDLTVIAFGQGPGGFTGLRVACGVAQGIAFGLGLPVVAVPSLLAVAEAENSEQHDIQVVILDARMDELYVAAYSQPPRETAASDESADNSSDTKESALSAGNHASASTGFLGWQVVHEPILIEANHFPLWLNEQRQQWGMDKVVQVVGNGLQVCHDNEISLPTTSELLVGAEVMPKVEAVARLGWQGWQMQQTIAPQDAAPLYIRDKVAFTIAERAQGLGGNPSADWQPLQIERLQTAHIPQVAQLGQATGAASWSEAQWYSGLQAGQFGWVLERAGVVYAFLWVNQIGPESELLLMATHPEYQRRGYATWLLNTWQQYALEQGVEQLHLEVRAGNQAAQQLYKGFGFEQVGVRSDYYQASSGGREDAHLYTKALTL